MKKIFTTLLFAAAAITVSAQTFQILDKKTEAAITSKTVKVNPTKGDTSKFYVKNLTSAAQEFKVKMTVVSSPSLSNTVKVLQFCDQNVCLSPGLTGVAESDDPNAIAANETLGKGAGLGFGFVVYLVPNSEVPDLTGNYVITFDIYNVANPSDKTTLTLTYDATVGIQENLSNYKLGDAYPSPANENVTIDYNFVAQPKTATLELYNVVGVKINEINIEGTEGKIKMDVSNLSNGVYFYSLLVDGEKVSTKKVVIAD